MQMKPTGDEQPLEYRHRRLKIIFSIAVVLLFCALGCIAYLMWTKARQQEFVQAKETQIASVDSIRTQLLEKYNVELADLDQRLALAPKSFASLMAEFKKEPRTYNIGLTSKSGVSLANLAGEGVVSRNALSALSEESRRTKTLLQAGKAGRSYLRLRGHLLSPAADSLDLRDYLPINEPRDQYNTKACWAFSAAATYETAYLLRYNQGIEIAPQQIIYCSQAGSATNGGSTILVFSKLVNDKISLVDEPIVPYIGLDSNCPRNVPTKPYYTIHWALVDPANNPNTIPPREEIKKSICSHGPVSASMTVTDLFSIYVGGVFKGKAEGDSTNHAIQIIGWNDRLHAWLCKNSYGLDWGETCGRGKTRGFFWIDYDSFNIGKNAAWVMPSTSPG